MKDERGIDWNALGETLRRNQQAMNYELNSKYTNRVPRDDLIRAVEVGSAEQARLLVAALSEQGWCVVRRGLLEIARCELDAYESRSGGSVFWREVDEIDAILATPPTTGGDDGR